MSFLSGGLGAIVGGVTGLIGGALDAHNDRKMAQMGYDFQREVYKNQYQWKAADAKKAGLHPLAVLGGGSYSGSPVSTGGTSYAKALGELGEGIGDAATAYMNRDEIAAEKAKADQKFNKELDLLDAQIGEIRARTQESLNRALSFSKPMATGGELMAGQTDSGRVPSGIVKSHPSYVIRDMGNGLYDINFSTDYQQEIGDELGQLVNFYHQGKRHLGSKWRDPKTGVRYYRVPEQGYWVRGDKPGYSNDRRTVYGHIQY